MLNVKELIETDPAEKTEQWASNLVSYFRSYWQPLVDPGAASDNMDIILSRYNMEHVMKMFKDPKKLEMEFIAICIMEKVRNILVSESDKAGITASVNALDPVAEDDRKKDNKLLSNRKEVEDVVSFMQQSMGLPEYNMQNEKTLGKDPFKGNIEMFDDLGLDASDPQDRGYFMKAWHRLKYEMDAQEIVNSFLAYNEVNENIESWVNDMLGKKAIAKQSYVNELTGAIEHRRLIPEHTYCIPGKRNDGKDAACIGYVETVTIGTVIKKLGNAFSLKDDWIFFINAINTTHKKDYEGIYDGKNVMFNKSGTSDNSKCVHIDNFLNFKIEFGYIEWKSWDQKVYKVGVDFNGNLHYYDRGIDYVPEDTGYTKESWFTENTYKAFYIGTSTNTQKLYKFGKLYHQLISGAEDEYSSYTIGYKIVPGPTAAEVAKPWIVIAQEAFTKYRWMVRRAKPKGRSYNYESLVQIAKHMIKKGDTKYQVHEVIKMFEEGINELFTIPKVDGQRVGGGIIPNIDLPNGLDPTAPLFGQIVDSAVNHIKEDLGINDIREAYSPKQNDVYKLQMATLESSRNATAYIGRTLDWVGRDIAKTTLMLAQDIVAYQSSLAYKFLINLVGFSPVKSMQDLGNIALHRFGIFINSFSSYLERQNILRDTETAFQNKEITFDVKILINSVDDYRKAAYILAYEKQRAQKQKDKDMQMAQQNAMAQIDRTHAAKMEEINATGQWDWKKEDRKGWWNFQINRDDNSTKERATQQKGQQRAEEIDNKADATIRQTAAKQNIQNQEPLTT